MQDGIVTTWRRQRRINSLIMIIIMTLIMMMILVVAHRWLVEDEYNLKKFDRWTVRGIIILHQASMVRF